MSKPVPPKREAAPAEAPELEITGRAIYDVGDVIAGKYELKEMLGEGGMGSVWLARNRTLDIDVAVKLIRRDVASGETAERLLREARVAAKIDHASIVRVFDFGETEYRDPFIVMEALKGESLRAVLDRKEKLLAENAVQTLLPVASALVAAHAQGVVHRDLKPENVILVPGEGGSIVPKLVDFGIAKPSAEEDRKVTKAGAILGSPDYMSPEQARGRTDIDERSDVWSLAVVLYELVSGRLPFFGPNYHALLMAIIENEPQPFAEMSVGDDALWAIVARGLTKDREQRWASMKELGEALASWALERGIDIDVTGAAVSIAWLGAGPARPLSERPPSLADARVSGMLSRPSLSAIQPTPPVEPAAVSPPEPALVPPAATAKAEAPRSTRLGLFTAVALVVAIGGAAILAWSLTRPSTPTVASSAPIASTKPPPEPTASVTQSPPPIASEAAGLGSRACVLAQFPEGTFGAVDPDPQAICAETDPRRGADALHGRIVRGGGKAVTTAMQEWALMSWYEMAAFSVVRGRCCPGAAALKLPPPVGACTPIDAPLNDLAAHAGDEEAKAAAARFRQAVFCLIGANVTNVYKYRGKPEGGEEGAFERTLSRGRGSSH